MGWVYGRMGIWAYGRMGYGMGYGIGMGLWAWGGDGVGLGWDGLLGDGIWAASIIWIIVCLIIIYIINNNHD